MTTEADLSAIVRTKRDQLGIKPDDLTRKLWPSIAVEPPEIDPAEAERRELARQAWAKEQLERERRQTIDGALQKCFAGRGRYRQCRLANFRCASETQLAALESVKAYSDDIKARVTNGQGVIFLGPPGTGKDHLMAALIGKAVIEGCRVVWKNGMDLFGEVRDRMDTDKTEASFVRSLVEPDVLALSDPLPPFGDLTAFQAATLFRVIDGRYSEGKPTWITINVKNRIEAGERMGFQISDRLTHGALVVVCDWESYRKPK